MTTKKKPASLEDFVLIRHGKTMVEARIISSDGAPKPPSSIGSTSDDDNDGWIYVQYLINSAVKQYVLASNVTPMFPEVDEQQAESNRFPHRSTRRSNHPKAAPAAEFASSSRVNAEACAALQPPLKKPRHQEQTVEKFVEQTNKSSVLELNDRDGVLQAQCSTLLLPKDDCEALKPTNTSSIPTTTTKQTNLFGTELEKVLKPATKSIPTTVATNAEYSIGTEMAKVSTRSCNWDQENNSSHSSLFNPSFLSIFRKVLLR